MIVGRFWASAYSTGISDVCAAWPFGAAASAGANGTAAPRQESGLHKG